MGLVLDILYIITEQLKTRHTDEKIHKLCHTHSVAVNYYSAIERIEILLHILTGVVFKNIAQWKVLDIIENIFVIYWKNYEL